MRRLTQDGGPAGMTNGIVGLYANTLRQRLTVRSGEPGLVRADRAQLNGRRSFVQVSRMGNPLVNELIIPIGRKDFWNATAPEDESLFVDAYRGLDVAAALQAVSGVPVPSAARRPTRPASPTAAGPTTT